VICPARLCGSAAACAAAIEAAAGTRLVVAGAAAAAAAEVAAVGVCCAERLIFTQATVHLWCRSRAKQDTQIVSEAYSDTDKQ
jgi:hypothetical protein